MSRSNVSAVSVEAKAKALSRAEPRLQCVQSEQALVDSAQLCHRPLVQSDFARAEGEPLEMKTFLHGRERAL
jgi:hypothetical protein